MKGEPILRAMEACNRKEVVEGVSRNGDRVRGKIARVQGPNPDGDIVAEIADETAGPDEPDSQWCRVEDLEFPNREEEA